jgi:hypothetical protein
MKGAPINYDMKSDENSTEMLCLQPQELSDVLTNDYQFIGTT